MVAQGRALAAAPTDASPGRRLNPMPYVITEPCIDVKDGSCVDACPVDCIKTTPDHRMYYIDPDRCIDCNACRHVCPVDAIYSSWELPEGQEEYERINAEFFKTVPVSAQR